MSRRSFSTKVFEKIKWYYSRAKYIRNITINGKKTIIPNIDGVICVHSEEWMTEVIKLALSIKKGVFIDVGVNLGQTLIKVKSLAEEIEYIGFEPNPSCVFYLNKLIECNKFESCNIVPVGIYTENRVLSLELFCNDVADSSASIIENYRPKDSVISRINVPVFDFGSIKTLFNISDIGIIKIDVEGAELEVIESLLNDIKEYGPIILLEVLPVYSSSNNLRLERQIKLEKLLVSIDYIMYRIKKSDDDMFLSLEKINCIGIHSSLENCDYLLAPDGLAINL